MRLPGWRDNLKRFVIGTTSEAPRIGGLDCFSFSCGAVYAQTGEWIFPESLDYDDMQDGLLQMRKIGFRNHIQFMLSKFQESTVFEEGFLLFSGYSNTDTLGIRFGGKFCSVSEKTVSTRVILPTDRSMRIS